MEASWTTHKYLKLLIYAKTTITACVVRRIAEKMLKQTSQPVFGSQVSYCSVIWWNVAAGEIKRLKTEACFKVCVRLLCFTNAKYSWVVSQILLMKTFSSN